MKQKRPIWHWKGGIVDRAGDHFELRYGDARRDGGWDDWLPVALVGPPVQRTLSVEFLLGYNRQPLPPDLMTKVRKEIDFLLTIGQPDPWHYRKYHCGTVANAMGLVHWSFFPRGWMEWSWTEGAVDRAGDHLELRYGDPNGDAHWEDWLPVALVGPPDTHTFPVEFLKDDDGAPLPPGILAEVRRELDMYLLDVGRPDPWTYAQYHCGTEANARSPVCWSFFPKGWAHHKNSQQNPA